MYFALNLLKSICLFLQENNQKRRYLITSLMLFGMTRLVFSLWARKTERELCQFIPAKWLVRLHFIINANELDTCIAELRAAAQ